MPCGGFIILGSSALVPMAASSHPCGESPCWGHPLDGSPGTQAGGGPGTYCPVGLPTYIQEGLLSFTFFVLLTPSSENNKFHKWVTFIKITLLFVYFSD